MPQLLPSSLDLLKDSWRLYITTWNESLKISIWFLYFGLIAFVLSIIEKFSPSASTLFEIPVSLAIGIVAYWVGVRLIQGMLCLEAGKKIDFSKEESRRAWNLVLPTLWVAILQTLVVIGGFMLFIFPGVFFVIALSFSQMIVIDQGVRGMQAIKASRDLVKGRWSQTAWRLFVTSFALGLAVMVVTALGFVALMLIAGLAESIAKQPDPLFTGTQSLFSSIIQAAILPLFIGLHVKIYRALQRTR